MSNFFRIFFGTFGPSARQVKDRQLHAAQIQLLYHAAEAEHHAAMTNMYRERCARLQPTIPTAAVWTVKT